VSREGYMFHSENFKLKTKGIAEPYELNVPLKKITTGNSVVLQNVFFDTDSYELKESSKIELGRLVSFMNLNPDLRIEIGGHTDNIGSDTDNVLLSKSRAESVAKFVVDSGIVADRVSAKGYGETAPIDSNKTDYGRAANRRTEFKIN
ncbi:MAG: OmpA family protein, partial [Flavobacteriales bacterium]